MIQLGLQREEANSNTTGLYTYNQDWFRKAKPVRDAEATDDMRPRWVSQPRKWASTPKRWRNAVPRRVWWATYISIGLVLLVVLIILGIAFEDYSGATGGLHDTGFGDNPHNFQIHLFNNRAPGAIVANLPQSILTGCYFWFTALYVRMFQARDWANFAVEGYLQRIMVTEPTEPDQKDSYWLGIPLAWGLLFLACSIALHWTTGQSIYQIASEGIVAFAYSTFEIRIT
jgi:H+/Cl- antiporter ClcA